MKPMIDNCLAPLSVSDDDVLRFARRTLASSTAPPEWQPGHPMIGFTPPWPQPELMRGGALGQHGADRRFAPDPDATPKQAG